MNPNTYSRRIEVWPDLDCGPADVIRLPYGNNVVLPHLWDGEGYVAEETKDGFFPGSIIRRIAFGEDWRDVVATLAAEGALATAESRLAERQAKDDIAEEAARLRGLVEMEKACHDGYYRGMS